MSWDHVIMALPAPGPRLHRARARARQVHRAVPFPPDGRSPSPPFARHGDSAQRHPHHASSMPPSTSLHVPSSAASPMTSRASYLYMPPTLYAPHTLYAASPMPFRASYPSPPASPFLSTLFDLRPHTLPSAPSRNVHPIPFFSRFAGALLVVPIGPCP